MAGHGRKDIDEQLLQIRAAGGSISFAAQKLGCSEQTIRRRQANPAFRERLSALRSEFVADTVGRLSTIGTAAVDELYRLIKHGKDDHVRLGAARAAVTLMLSGHEHELLVVQVNELQRQIDELTCDTSYRGKTSENLP
jgi:hypothetical protein